MKKLYTVVLVVLALASVAAAVVYFTHTANNLPHFFPGYSANIVRKHAKHGIAFIGLAVVLLLAAWMISGSKPAASKSASTNDDQEA